MQISQLVNDIEQGFIDSGRTEVGSREVGQSVLAALKNVDFVGYVRYASVYDDFQKPEDFMALLGRR